MMATETKEKPIIFSTEMVQAILNGQKTQTRRVIKPQPYRDKFYGPEWYRPVTIDKDGEEAPGKPVYGIYGVYGIYNEWGEWGIKCPYPPGTILWVRETWGIPITSAGKVIYKADYMDRKAPLADGEKWRPSIHMPRAAARIFLEVKGVRVERLQEITEEDAIAEGIRWTEEGPLHAHLYDAELDAYLNFSIAKEAFKHLWNSINGKKYPWESNPWVWVYSFMRRKDYGRNKI